MILDDIDTIEFDRNKEQILGVKSAILWGHKGSSATPLMYFRKPKNMPQEDFDNILDNLQINILKNKR